MNLIKAFLALSMTISIFNILAIISVCLVAFLTWQLFRGEPVSLYLIITIAALAYYASWLSKMLVTLLPPNAFIKTIDPKKNVKLDFPVIEKRNGS